MFIKAIKRNKLPLLSPPVINNVGLLYHLRFTRYGHSMYDWGGGFQMTSLESLFKSKILCEEFKHPKSGP